jgi:hypothetical protein
VLFQAGTLPALDIRRPGMDLDPQTGQYYYHAYLPQQPDLNWQEPEVQDAMHGVMRFCPLASTASEKLHLRGTEGIIARLV